jgi:hypothetical protein
MTLELFVIEDSTGELADYGDNGGFTVYLDAASAAEMAEGHHENEETVVRFVRESVTDVERKFLDAALAFADPKASLGDQAAEYKRTLADLQAARGKS